MNSGCEACRILVVPMEGCLYKKEKKKGGGMMGDDGGLCWVGWCWCADSAEEFMGAVVDRDPSSVCFDVVF